MNDRTDEQLFPLEAPFVRPPGRCPCGKRVGTVLDAAGVQVDSATCGENDHLFWPETAPPLWRLPAEWERVEGVRVVDPDGWRGPTGKDFTVPILRAEWDVRVNQSTVESPDA